ncbi:MAG: Calx-beta domain-containing protein, partial [Candidatus Hydrogenedentota bacterium]
MHNVPLIVTTHGASSRSSIPRASARWVLAACALAAFAGQAWSQTADLLFDDFEGPQVLDDWALSGDWRVKENSACLPNSVGYISPVNALAFDFGSECSYRNNRSGSATLTFDVNVPITMPSATLEWWDFVGAELGSDFYFVQVSEDGGTTWPFEIYRDSKDEKFWDQESADLTPFIGKSIRVRFGFTSDDSITGLGWYIDDVRLFGEVLEADVSAVALSDVSISEGDGGTQLLNFDIAIEPANAEDIVLEHQTVNGSAAAGLDYVARSGRLTIPAASTSFTIPVTINGDSFFEADETFSVLLSSASANAHITIATATGTIVDDEGLVCLPIVGGVTVEDWEPRAGAVPWSTTGLWHIQESSACIEGEDGFNSPTHAMVYNNG